MGGQIALHTALRHPRARALARAARLEPGVRARRHRSRGLEAAPPRSAGRRRDAGEHRRARAPLDHGARTPTTARSPPPSRRCRASRPTGCARRSSACPRTTCAAGSARSPCRRSCSSASTTRRRRSRTPRRSPPASAGARLQIIPGAGHISNLEAPEAVNVALREHLDAVEAARMTEWRWLDVFAAPAARLRAQPRRGRRGALGVGQPARAGRDEPHRRADAGRSRLRRRRADARRTRARWRCARPAPRVALAGNRGAIAGARGRRPRDRLHRRGPAARARARRDPARRRARADDQQRAPRELRALRRGPDARARASSAAWPCSRRRPRCA